MAVVKQGFCIHQAPFVLNHTLCLNCHGQPDLDIMPEMRTPPGKPASLGTIDPPDVATSFLLGQARRLGSLNLERGDERMRTSEALLPAVGLVVLLCAGAGFGRGADVEADPQAPGSPPAAAGANQVQLSTNTLEVLRLAESGVEEEIIIAYIENSRAAFALSAEDVIYLKDLGIESSVVAAMLRHDTALRDQQLQLGVTNQDTTGLTVQETTNASPVVAAPPVYVSNPPPDVAYFYNNLEPYGAWVDLEGSGWCWQPHVMVINRYWRPYWQDGRWIYTDCGWYWQSDYSWGWAVFHYGRWHHHERHGWVWFPDRVWAPAWVTWRYSDTHCGWAPLPPGARFDIGHGFRFNNVSVGINFDFGLTLDLFSFVEIKHLHDRYPHLHAVPAPRVRDIYNQTIIHNNYAAGSNNRIINRGLDVERVAGASGSRIRPVTIHDGPAAPGRGSAPDRIERVGADRVLYRPQLRPPATPAAPPIAQKIDERHPVVRPTLRRPPTVTPSAPRPQPPAARPSPSQPPAARPLPSRPAAPQPSPSPPPAAQPSPSRPPVPPSAPVIRPTPPSRPPAASPGRREERPAVQPTPPGQPPSSQPRTSPAPSAPTLGPRPTPSPPRESPRGRDQRLSNGQRMQLPVKPPASPSTSPRSSPPQQPRSANDERRKK